MSAVTDDDVQELVKTAQPYSIAILSWGPERFRDGADEIEREHQRRMVSLRRDGTIAVLCPIVSDTRCGMAVMTVSADEAQAVMNDDPCVKAAMMTVEVYACHGFPGDTVPA